MSTLSSAEAVACLTINRLSFIVSMRRLVWIESADKKSLRRSTKSCARSENLCSQTLLEKNLTGNDSQQHAEQFDPSSLTDDFFPLIQVKNICALVDEVSCLLDESFETASHGLSIRPDPVDVFNSRQSDKKIDKAGDGAGTEHTGVRHSGFPPSRP